MAIFFGWRDYIFLKKNLVKNIFDIEKKIIKIYNWFCVFEEIGM